MKVWAKLEFLALGALTIELIDVLVLENSINLFCSSYVKSPTTTFMISCCESLGFSYLTIVFESLYSVVKNIKDFLTYSSLSNPLTNSRASWVNSRNFPGVKSLSLRRYSRMVLILRSIWCRLKSRSPIIWLHVVLHLSGSISTSYLGISLVFLYFLRYRHSAQKNFLSV